MFDPQIHLQKTLANFVENLKAHHPEKLLAIIQFGSTAKAPAKTQTDIDLMVIFTDLPPNRSAIFDFTDAAEGAVQELLTEARSHGYDWILSVVPRSRATFQKFSLLYLDMLAASKIWYDRDGLVQPVFEDTKKWILENNAKQLNFKGTKYWSFGSMGKNGEMPVVPMSFPKHRQK